MTIYYVNSSLGNNNNNGTSTSTPFATIQQAADRTQPGDKVEVMAGTYSADAATGYVLATGHSGAAGAPIVFEGYNGARPVISMPSGGVSAVQINGSYVTFSGFELIGNAQNVSLAQAQSLAAQPGSGSNRTIAGSGITVSWNGNPTIVNHVSILNNVVHDFAANGISAEESDYITVQGNTVYNNGKYGPYGTSGVSLFGSHDSDSATGYKNFVVGNVLYNNQQLVGSYAIGTSAITDGEGLLIDSNSNFQTDGVQYKGSTLVANNIAYGNSAVGLGAYASSNVDFIGNTTYGNDPAGTHGGQIGSSKLNGGKFENNIAVAGPGGTAFGIDGTNSNVTEDYNLVYGGNAATGGAHDIKADPKFVDAGAANFQLQAGSAAIGIANPAYVQPIDQAGNARPSNAPADVGALEHQIGTAAPPNPPPPVVVTPPPPVVVAAPVTLGSGSSSIVVGVSEDAYQGDAQFTVSVDGAQVGGTQTATASHAAGKSQAFTLLGNWAAGAHTVAVSFLNDLYGGGGTADRNLYVDGVTAGGTTVPGAPLYGNGTQSFTATVPAPPPPVVIELPPPPPPVSPVMPVTLGSGSSSIVVGVSEDAFQGDAQFTVSVDGAQIGGTQTATASHAAGKSQAFTLLGNWAAGAHTVAVSFLNDLYGGGGTADRNLYVDGVTAGGTTVPGAPLYGNGTQSFTATLPPPPVVVVPPPPPTVMTLGSGSSSIVVGVSEDAYQGDAQFTVSVDGTQVGGTQTATASHAAGKSQAFTLLGNWAAGAHTVAVSFLNDLYGGGGTADRNLYVDGVTAGGTTVPGAPLYGNGTQSFTATLTSSVTTIGSGAGSITLGVSEDAYQGDAQFTVSVDGTQIGGTQTATAAHAAGKSQVFNVLGAFGAGPHSVSVNFLNDAWGGTAATDRNLYVDSFTAGGVTKPVGLALMAPGSQSFTTPSVIGPATLGSNPTLAFVAAAKAVTIDGGTVAGKTLTGGTARDVFVLHAGASNGDTITNFKPSLTAGDFLELKGYGTGATLTQVDSTTWTANSASGAIHDVIKLTNAAALVPANVLFA